MAGVSEILKTGFITYSNKAKHKFLGVKKLTLMKDGAVSEQCA
ncbi:MAG: CinA family protein, partial [Clostridia bacterium]|nr:CinA family protein [Clostridia bacterium]